MSNLLIVPSKGRPDSALRLYTEWLRTSDWSDDILFAVDEDDPTLEEYDHVVPGHVVEVKPVGGMSAAANQALKKASNNEVWPGYDIRDFDHIGFMGDDHSIKTNGWSNIVFESGFGVTYGPDGSDNLARELPTFWFVSTSIVEALGWISPPYCNHFYLDDIWRDIAKAAGVLHYEPDLYIEHLHFSFGKSEKDATYESTMKAGSGDYARYHSYINSHQFQDDVDTVKRLL